MFIKYIKIKLNIKFIFSMLLCAISYINLSIQQQQQSSDQHQLLLKTEPITLDLYHKFSFHEEFKLRGSILIKPKTEYRIAQASIIQQNEITDDDLKNLKESYEQSDNYYIKASQRLKNKNSEGKVSQTLTRACSLYTTNFVDFITVNLSPTNEFLNVNFFNFDPECLGDIPSKLSRQFNTTILIESTSLGPIPDTATYIKRLEEERQNKAKEGKEDNRSFFAKYWVYIVPAVVVLMIFSGPNEGGR